MKNTIKGKKPAEWFEMLKEPYKSQAIVGIKFNKDKLYYSLLKALMNSTNWIELKFDKVIESLNKGETTYLESTTQTE